MPILALLVKTHSQRYCGLSRFVSFNKYKIEVNRGISSISWQIHKYRLVIMIFSTIRQHIVVQTSITSCG
jgi:hypothetical protein